MKKKLFIVKIGGNVIDDEQSRKKFLFNFSKIKERKILVHGGGKIASELAEKLGISQEIVNGRRITNAETLKIVTMVYAGLLNKQIVALLQSNNVNAIGLSGADMNCIKAVKRMNLEIDFGFVGDIIENGVNPELISSLIENNLTPVFCSVTHDGKGQLLNTNADTIASALAISFSYNYDVQLNFCFEKNGVLKNIEDANSVIETMTKTEYKKLLEEGIISKGMIPKLDNSFEALNKGVKKVVIGHSGKLNTMISENKIDGTVLIA